MDGSRIDTLTNPPITLPAPTLPSPAPDSPEEALSWLGGTVEEVAEGLRATGIKGTKARAGSCPLANYLKCWWVEAHVWCSFAVIIPGGMWSEVTPCPLHVFEFAIQFDNGAFPDLIAD